MAKLKAILMFGQSNMEGMAPWTELQDSDWYRYFGALDSGAQTKPASLTNWGNTNTYYGTATALGSSAGSTSTIIDKNLMFDVAEFPTKTARDFTNMIVTIVDAPGVPELNGQVSTVTGVTAATFTISVSPVFTANVPSGTTYTIRGVDRKLHGINIWTPKMPSSPADIRKVASSGSATTFVTTGLTADAHVGQMIYFAANTTTAALQSDRYQITANTATTVTFETAAGAVALNDVAMITSQFKAGAGSTLNAIKLPSSDVLTVNSLQNKWIICESGANGGLARLVRSNTASTVIVNEPWIADPASGDLFRISTAGTQGAPYDYLTASNPTFSYEGKFLPFQLFYQASSQYQYETGYDYPNIHGTPLFSPAFHGSLIYAGPMVEIMWQMRHEFLDSDLWVLQMPIPYSFMSVQKGALLTGLSYSWFNTKRMNDWNPSSTEVHGDLSAQTTNACFYDLYGLFIDYLLKTQIPAWLATNRPGDTLDVQGVFVALGEAESLDYTNDPSRAENAGRNMRLLRDTMRKAIYDAGYTTIAQDRIPWSMSLMDEVGYPGGVVVNPQYRELALEDPYTRVVEVEGLPVRTTDALHFNADSYVTIGERHAENWRAMRAFESAASTPEAKRKTLEGLRTLVKARYERNSVTTDSTNASIDAAINDAHRLIFNELGDQAWFLNVIEDIEFTGSYDQSLSTLPKRIKRLLRIENPDMPGTYVPWKLVGYSSQGELQVSVPQLAAGTYTCHYRLQPVDLGGDTDVSIVPDEFRELIVVAACRRLAEASGNRDLLAVYASEQERQLILAKRDARRHNQQRYQNLETRADVYGVHRDYDADYGTARGRDSGWWPM